jgi:hypothetical protein
MAGSGGIPVGCPGDAQFRYNTIKKAGFRLTWAVPCKIAE